MAQWEIQLGGSKSDLDDLCAVFTSPPIKVESRGNSYFLKAESLSALQSHKEVEVQAAELVALLAGASRLTLGSRATIHVANIALLNDDGTRSVFLAAHDTIGVTVRAELEIRSADGKITRVLPAARAPEWMSIAVSNPAVAKALRLFGANSGSWVDLYRILEVIIGNVGGVDALAARGWITKAKIRLFKHTANSVAASGDEARHGHEDSSPPPLPMDLSEARALLSVVLQSWLREKVATSGGAA